MSPAAPQRPRVVQTGCILWISGLISGMVGQYLLSPLTDLAAARTRVPARAAPGLSGQQIDTAVTLSVVGALVFVLVLVMVEGFLLSKLWAGHRWPRGALVTLAVLGGLTDLRQGTALAEALNIVSLLLIAAGIVAIYRPTASAYFSRRHR